MTPSELKNSILQLAIQGKLVLQDDKEQIMDKHAFMLDEPPFDVPESWKWNTIGNCCEMYTGNSISESEKKAKYDGLKEGYDYIGTKDVSFNHVISYDNGIRIPYHTDFKIAYKEAILMCIEGGSAGRKIAILNKDVCFGNKLCMFKSKSVLNTFLFYYLQSLEFKKSFSDNMTGIIGGVSIKKLKEILLPIPPLAEQKRIVAKIEELLPLVDRYAEAWNRLEALNKRFPDDLKKSLLQLAIQGKLVPQLPDEGTGEELYRKIQSEKQALIKEGKIKKEKPLPEISDDEKPFDIPESWRWVRLGDIAFIQSSKRVFEKDYVSDGIPFFRSKEIGDLCRGEQIKTQLFITREHYERLKEEYGVPQKGDILITSVGTIGNTWLCDGREFYYKDGNITQICSSKLFYSKYVQLFINSPLFFSQAKATVAGTAYSALTIIKLKQMLLPLPPLAEQKRIVAKLEEILPLCERLK